MIALEQVRQYLETLGLKQAVEVLDNTLDAAASKQLTYPELLAELLGVEVAARRERYLTTRTRLAHLPFQRTFEQFDFAFQPSIDERLVKELAKRCSRGSTPPGATRLGANARPGSSHVRSELHRVRGTGPGVKGGGKVGHVGGPIVGLRLSTFRAHCLK